ncbi:MAG: transaldolase [Anaerolineales bacterium]|nr:transaldolase [Anaerolineales bacterium]
MADLKSLNELGQSIWYDNIRRTLIESGEFEKMFKTGVTGVTSNPSIFEKAIAGSSDYDEALDPLLSAGLPVKKIYETLAIEDIQRTADLLRTIYADTDGKDGFVSIEVSPELANDTDGTIAEARRLYAEVGRPNVMIKVPATRAGIPAIETLIGEGINVNVTLIFSLDRYAEAAEAYIRGVEELGRRGEDLRRVSSVASFFVSRVDTAVDRALNEKRAESLHGKIAIANAKVAYTRFMEIFSGERWEALVEKGAWVQRPLWASTSTKNPAYADTLYVDSLIGPETVNTVPPATLEAFIDHGTIAHTLELDVEVAEEELQQLSELGIDLDDITDQLLREGVDAFAKSFRSVLASIEGKYGDAHGG